MHSDMFLFLEHSDKLGTIKKNVFLIYKKTQNVANMKHKLDYIKLQDRYIESRAF